jgi:hypothetical protein
MFGPSLSSARDVARLTSALSSPERKTKALAFYFYTKTVWTVFLVGVVIACAAAGLAPWAAAACQVSLLLCLFSVLFSFSVLFVV